MASGDSAEQDGGGDVKYLEVRVEEATGSNKETSNTWDDDIKEGFIKVELRGEGAKPVKKTTRTVPAIRTEKDGAPPDMKMVWREPLYLEILNNSTELRLLLCREKEGNGKKSTNVVTACGIFVKDILDAVPIDKYFEMFKPGTGKEGGFVRLKMNIISEADMNSIQKQEKMGGRGAVKGFLVFGALVATGVAVVQRVRSRS
jgi:hypothetical protein